MLRFRPIRRSVLHASSLLRCSRRAKSHDAAEVGRMVCADVMVGTISGIPSRRLGDDSHDKRGEVNRSTFIQTSRTPDAGPSSFSPTLLPARTARISGWTAAWPRRTRAVRVSFSGAEAGLRQGQRRDIGTPSLRESRGRSHAVTQTGSERIRRRPAAAAPGLSVCPKGGRGSPDDRARSHQGYSVNLQQH